LPPSQAGPPRPNAQGRHAQVKPGLSSSDNSIVSYPDEPLRVVVYRMAETGLTRFPVVERAETQRLAGIIVLTDLLEARARHLEAERRRESILPLRLVLPWGPRRRKKADGG